MKYRILERGDTQENVYFYPQYKYKLLPLWLYWHTINIGGGADRKYYDTKEDALSFIDSYKESIKVTSAKYTQVHSVD